MTASKIKILIIDDELSFNDWLTIVLNGAGYEVESMLDGSGLLERLTHGDIDLVLIDYHLPGKSGLQLVEDAIAAHHSTPIIVLTADSGQQVAVACFRAGAADFISKPIDPDYLEIVVERTLASKAVKLKDSALKSLSYMRHKEDCRFLTDHKNCNCGLSEIVSTISQF